jgi:uncharacterized protein YebE (UPF0316 family)
METLLLRFSTLLHQLELVNQLWWAQIPLVAGPLTIFLLRSLDQTAATFRTLVITQGRRGLGWLLGLLQAGFFLAAFSGLLSQLDQPLNALAFAAGYGTGGFLGISIDRWIAPGYAILRIVSPGKGTALAQALRSQGLAITELAGRGLQGTVSVLLATIPRRQVLKLRSQLLELEPDAFITAENIQVLQGGWFELKA